MVPILPLRAFEDCSYYSLKVLLLTITIYSIPKQTNKHYIFLLLLGQLTSFFGNTEKFIMKTKDILCGGRRKTQQFPFSVKVNNINMIYVSP